MPAIGMVAESEVIIGWAAVELGLVSSIDNVGDPFSNPKLYRLNQLVQSLGQDLARDHDWPQLRKESSFVASGSGVSLPNDFGRFVPGTVWKRGPAIPASPISAQEWQQLQAQGTAVTLVPRYRIKGNKVYTLPSDGSTLYYEYQSLYWLDAGSSGAPDSDVMDAEQQNIYFDYQLMLKGAKLYWKLDTGQDASREKDAFSLALARAEVSLATPPSVALSQAPWKPFSGNRLPDTGWGL